MLSELRFLLSLKMGRVSIISLFILVASLVAFRLNLPQWVLNISAIAGLSASYLFLYGAIKYARAKGRSPYFIHFLQLLGFLIVFFLKKKDVHPTTTQQPWRFIDVLLLVLFSISLIGLTLTLPVAMQLLEVGINTQHLVIPMLLSLLATVVILVVALILNRRKVAPFSILMTLVFFFFYFLSSGKSPQEFEATYIGFRNLMYFYFILYPLVHLLIVGISKIKQKNRELCSPEGLLFYSLVIMLTTFLHAFVTLFR